MTFSQYLGSAGDFDFTIPSNRYPSLDVQRTRENNAFDQGDVTARLAYRADPVTLAITTESFVKSQGVPADARVPSSTGHLDTQRNLAPLDLTTAPSGPWSIGLDGSLFGVFQQGTFTAEGPPDLGFPERTDVTSTATTVGGQVVGRGAIGTHQVPGLMVASTVERFVQSNAVETSRVRAGTSPAETRTRVALAGQDEVLLLGDRLSIVPNLRWELVHDDFPGDPRVKDPTLRVS